VDRGPLRGRWDCRKLSSPGTGLRPAHRPSRRSFRNPLIRAYARPVRARARTSGAP